MTYHRSLGIALGFALAGLAGVVRAESSLRLPYPSHFGAIPAATFDTDGKRVGAADVRIERLENGNVRIASESGVAFSGRYGLAVHLRFAGRSSYGSDVP